MKNAPATLSRIIILSLFFLIAAVGFAATVQAETTIFNSWNADATYSNPPLDPVFTITRPTAITTISNYHWNDYLGKDASLINGWIGIDQVVSDTESIPVGRWSAVSVDGAFGSHNTIWYAYPNYVLNPGTYKVVDSDRASWSYTVSNYYGYLGGTGKDWVPGKGFSFIVAAAGDVCSDGLDNDGNGLIDQADSDCAAGFCIQPPPDMTGWWPGDGNANDFVGASNGVMAGGATFAAGRVGQAFNLNGGGYVRVASNPSLNTPDGFTVDAWVYPRSNGGAQVIASKWDDPTNQWSWIFKRHNDGSGRLRIEISRGDHNALGDLGGATSLPLNNWSHVAATYDRSSGIIRLYVNGAIDSEGSAQFPGVAINNSSTDLLIGAVNGQTTPPGEHFDGFIDELELFSRALSQDEIKAMFLAGSAGKCKPLPVTIDIKPGSFPNSINPRNKGVIPVAILSSASFDAATVDLASVRFGASGTKAASAHSALEDVNGDGRADLVLQFPTQSTGIVCGDTSATLTGATRDGIPLRGTDSVVTAGCK